MQDQIAAAIAHVRQSDSGWETHSLDIHLRGVAALARQFARSFHADEWARLAGLWHDLGKYAPDFQHYIRDASGYEREQAHIEEGRGADGKPRRRVDHSAAGAIHAVDRLGVPGIVLANLIAAHHAGLYDGTDLERGLQARERLDLALSAEIPPDVVDGAVPALAIPAGITAPGAYALWLRMLFSCLVDADFLDTERFMDAGGKPEQRASFPAFDTQGHDLEP